MYSDYPHVVKRIALKKKGMNDSQIDKIFREFSLTEIENSKKTLEAVYDLLNKDGNWSTLHLVEEVIQFLLANQDTDDFYIRCLKSESGYWSYVIAEP